MEALDILDALVGDTRARLLRLVRRAALSIAELAEALDISENAVRTHVAAAERDGLVRQAGTRRSTGGKPARTYELAPGAEELFPKAHALVFTELVRTLRDEDGEAATLALLRRVGRRLGAGVAAAEGAPDGVTDDRGRAGRVHAAAALLDSIGGSTEVLAEPHGWTIRSDGCPLSGVVAEDPDVCVLAEALVAEATGLSVAEACHKSERPRCAFRVTRDDGMEDPSGGSA